jgi:dihydrofolate reductase
VIRASVFVGVSVDGFLARPDGSFDFLEAGGGEAHGYEEFFATVDVLLIGRMTYEVVRAFASWPYGKTPVFVLSTSPIADDRVERLEGEPRDLLAALEARGFGHAYVDGGVTMQRFLRAGAIDRLVVTRVPVLIGSGIPLFGPVDADILLEHVATRTYPTGLVQSEYSLKAAS